MDAMLAYMRTHPTRPNVRSLLRGSARMARHPKQLAALGRYFSVSQAQIIDELFESSLIRGALAQMPTFDWMRRDGTAWGMIYVALVHRTRSARYIGGTGALPKALAACLRDHGGSIRTSTEVEQILVSDGCVRGVRLVSGEELHAQTVLAACDPKTALSKLLPAGALPERLAAAAAHIPTSTTGGGHVKINLALKGRLTLRRHSAWRADDLDVRMPLTCWHTFEEHVAGTQRCAANGPRASRSWPASRPRSTRPKRQTVRTRCGSGAGSCRTTPASRGTPQARPCTRR
jgi:phytoene dehydrogenase-like protein